MKDERTENIKRLLEKCNRTLFVRWDSMSKSGMTHYVEPIIFVMSEIGPYVLHPAHDIAMLTGRRTVVKNDRLLIKMGGTGYSHADALVQDLGQALYGDVRAIRMERF